MTITLRDLLNDGKVHVLDGAMGTMLYSKGFFLNVCYDELNLKQPELVQEVHAAYVRAGAEILETNTFGANPAKLGSFGLADDTEKVNQAAAELARAASGGQTSVVGAIGPLGVRIEPFGALAREEAFAHFQRQVTGLVAGGRGVDGFILETFSDVDELHEALRAVRSLSDLPVIAQMTIGDDGLTHYGTAPETFAQQLAEWGADVIGGNCSVGPAGGRRSGAARQAVVLRRQARGRPARHQRGDRAAARRRSGADVRAVPGLEGRGCGRGQRARRPARAEPHGRAALLYHDSARGGDRDRDPLLLPRPQPARHAVGRAGGGGGGTAQHSHHHRRPAQDGPVSRRDGGVRHRRDRAHQSGLSVEPRARPGKQPDRPADGVRDRRGREPGGDRSRPRVVALRLEGGRRGGLRCDTTGVRSQAARGLSQAGGAVPDPDRRGDLAARVAPERRVPCERGARRVGPRDGARPHEAGAGEGKRGGARRGRRDRARDVPAGEGRRAGHPGERAVRAGGGGAGGVRWVTP